MKWLALTKYRDWEALVGDGNGLRTRYVRTLTAESKTYKYMHYYHIR